MLKHWLFLIPFLFSISLGAQSSSTDPEYQAHPVGGDEQVDQVLQTQLQLPKLIATSDFETSITLYFNLDSAGRAFNMNAEGGVNNQLREEVKRIVRFLKFRHTLNLPNEPRPYFLAFNISREKYNRYFKQRHRFNIPKKLPADSSYVIYTRADHSPDYYKNGEEGMKDFILSEMEYPKVAIEHSVEGTVVIEFVVETNGFVTNIVPLKTVNAGCTEEALRIIKQTRWQPAVLNGKLVRYKMSYPITFSLRNTLRDFGTSSGTTGQ